MYVHLASRIACSSDMAGCPSLLPRSTWSSRQGHCPFLQRGHQCHATLYYKPTTMHTHDNGNLRPILNRPLCLKMPCIVLEVSGVLKAAVLCSRKYNAAANATSTTTTTSRADKNDLLGCFGAACTGPLQWNVCQWPIAHHHGEMARFKRCLTSNRGRVGLSWLGHGRRTAT